MTSNSLGFSALCIIQACFLWHSFKFTWPAFGSESRRGRACHFCHLHFLVISLCLCPFELREKLVSVAALPGAGMCSRGESAFWRPLPSVWPHVTHHSLSYLLSALSFFVSEGQWCAAVRKEWAARSLAWFVNVSYLPSITSWQESLKMHKAEEKPRLWYWALALSLVLQLELTRGQGSVVLVCSKLSWQMI